MKKLFNAVMFIFFGKGEKEMIDEGFISYEGQGRNKYGK